MKMINKKETVVQYKNMILSFLNVATTKGLINQDIRELETELSEKILTFETIRKNLECENIENLKKDELKKRIQAYSEDFNGIIMKIEMDMIKHTELVKERYLEFGAILHEIEESYIS